MRLDELLALSAPPAALALSEADQRRLYWKLRGLQKAQERDQAFWTATNANLRVAYERLDEQERELARTYDVLREDLSVAAQVQRGLHPAADVLPEMEVAVHHRQLTEVGGDYYDFFRTASGRPAIGVFDISGHGVGAALVMAWLKAQFAIALERFDEPAEVVQRVNEASFEFLRAVKKYATATFVTLGEGHLRYTCGGGYGLLVRAGLGAPFDRKDHFLGLRRKPFRQHELPFAAGDLVALYTDGIPEAQDAGGRDYSAARVQELLVRHHAEPLPALLDRLLTDYAAFRERDHDDVTVVLLRRRP